MISSYLPSLSAAFLFVSGSDFYSLFSNQTDCFVKETAISYVTPAQLFSRLHNADSCDFSYNIFRLPSCLHTTIKGTLK